MTHEDESWNELRHENADLKQEIAQCKSHIEHLESASQEIEQRYKALLYGLPEKVFYKNADLVYVSCNQNYAQDFGLTPEQMVGKTDYDLFPRDMADKYRADDRRIVASAVSEEIEETYGTPAGVRVVRTVKSPLKDERGNVTGIAGIFSDITQRKRDEEALRDARDELDAKVKERTAELAQANEELAIFQRFAEAAGQGFGMADLDGRITYLNPAMCRILGEEKPEDVVGRKSVADYYPEGYRETVGRQIVPVILRDGYWQGEQPVISRQGKLVPTLHNMFVVSDAAGNPIRHCVIITDISEHKAAEDALQQSHNELRAIYDGLLDGLVILDLETNKPLRVNAAFCRTLGYSADELALLSGPEITPPDAIEAMQACVEAAAQGCASRFESIPFVRKDGTIVYMDAITNPIVYNGRKCLLNFFRDITEQRKARAALETAHQKLTTTLESITDGFALLDHQWRYVYVNTAGTRLLRRSREEMLNHVAWDVFPEASQLKFYSEFRRAIEHHTPVHFEEFYPEGPGTWYECHCYPSSEGLSVYFRDITDQRKTEEALRQSHGQLQAIYDGMIEGLLITDIQTHRFIRVNSSLCRMLGYTEEELMKASLADIHPVEEVANDTKRFQATVEGRTSLSEDRPVLRKDGSIFYADITGHRILYAGRPCVLALFRDISERKQTQEALQRERRTLEHLLRSSDHERQLIAYEIHDGLAQYLAGAIMQFDVYGHLKEARPTEARDAWDAGMTMLRQGHFEARRLISGVRPPILDESGIVAALAHLVNEQRRQKKATIEFHSRVEFDRLVPILENAIYRIAQEALSNARQHSKSKKIVVELVQAGDRVRVVVTDWGIGFDPAESRDNCYGLEGIRERARLLGGHATIESAPGKGTRIAAELPVVVDENDR